MRKLILALLLGFMVGPVLAEDSCLSGSFYDPAVPGEGINVEILENTTLVFVYRTEGDWFLLQGSEGNFGAYQPWAGEVANVGRGDLVFLDNDTVRFSYDLLLDLTQANPGRPIPWCLRSDCYADTVLTRLTQPTPCE